MIVWFRPCILLGKRSESAGQQGQALHKTEGKKKKKEVVSSYSNISQYVEEYWAILY